VSTHHTAYTDETTVVVDVDCAYCGYAGTAAVRSRGKGTATSFVVFDRAHARDVASREAAEDLAHQARVTASLLPCPKCHRRSRAAVAQYVIGTVIGVVFLVALSVIAWWLTKPGGGRWLGAAAFLFAAVVLAANKRKRFRTIGAQLVGVRIRPVLPQASAVKLGPAVTPIASKAPDPQPVDDGTPREPKLLG
jgi:hypothetical protein